MTQTASLSLPASATGASAARTFPKLKVEDVSKSYGEGDKRVTIVDKVNFSLADNEFVALVGTSGCGKSTVLSIVAGLTEDYEGVVLVDDRQVVGPGVDRGMIFQSYSLMPWLTALGNVEFALEAVGVPRKERRERAMETLALVGLDRFADRFPAQLSGGMKQRVAIARALSYRPKMLLMDEPFGALDALTKRHLHEQLTTIWEKHRLTVLFVTHDVEEAIFLSDRVMIMSTMPGRIKQVVDVNLPRPRNGEMISSPEFTAYQKEILSSIREETLKLARLDGSAQ
ncbi:ABC transporter ATP-binding protein [Xanthobacter sp. ZOL 2024]